MHRSANSYGSGGYNSHTPLTQAAQSGKREACELLLQLKADINKT
jgi:hypothetical protein